MFHPLTYLVYFHAICSTQVRVKKPLKEQNNKGIPLEEAAQMAWQDYTNSNKSIIVKLFGGQLRSTVQCLTCSEESVTFEPFFNLSLPIPQLRNNCSIMVTKHLNIGGQKSRDNKSGSFRIAFLCTLLRNRYQDGFVHPASKTETPKRR